MACGGVGFFGLLWWGEFGGGGGGDWFWVSGVGRLLCGVNLGMMG